MSEVISSHGKILKTIRVGTNKIEYIVTDGDGRYSHGETIKEAKESLIYKLKDRDTTKYESLNVKSIVTFEEGVQCYRAITGACEAGVRGFIERTGKKEKYTIGEIIKITDGNYGHDTFKEFFT